MLTRYRTSSRSNTRSRTSDKSLDLRLTQAVANQKINENMETAEKQYATQRRPSASTSYSSSSGSTSTSTSWSSSVSPKTKRLSRSDAELPVVLPVENNGVVRMESIDESASGLQNQFAGRRASQRDSGEYYIKRYRKLSKHASKWSEEWTTEHYYRPPGCEDFVAVNRSSSRRSSDT